MIYGMRGKTATWGPVHRSIPEPALPVLLTGRLSSQALNGAPAGLPRYDGTREDEPKQRGSRRRPR